MSLEKLTLSANCIQIVSEDVFHNLTNLQTVSLLKESSPKIEVHIFPDKYQIGPSWSW